MPATDSIIDLAGAKVGGDVSIQFGLTAAPTSFRRLVGNFVKLYLGTEKSPVPFGGRGSEIEALNAWLDGRVENSSPAVLDGDRDSNNLLITAPAGRGKTALLVRWIEQLRTDWALVFVPVSIRAQTNQALTFYQAFAARLAEILEEPLPEPRADPATYYKDKVIDYIDRIGKGSENCLVVIDGLDEARGWKMDTTVLPVDASPRLKIVVSARELAGDNASQNWLDRLGWTPPLCSALTLHVEPLSREGIADVLAKMEFPIAPLSKDVDIIDELYRLTDEGDPLVLQYYANDLRKEGDKSARLRPTDLRKFEPGFGAYIKRWLEEQKDEWKSTGTSLDEDLVDAILAVLASAFGPLKLPELEELVTCVLPGNRIFSVRTIEPLRRFIVGDGKENGYALAHPKLANFLQHDYFAESKVLRDSKDGFVKWMREMVVSLNEDRRQPEDTPAYALLFYTQHLGAMSSDKALEHYRELVENGWRKAWEKHEGGLQGFSRDVELAARAFRTAADGNPDRLRMPRTGLGAQIRCALCLSSIRSAGFGATGEVLAEFLRSRMITPKQALYLALLKEDKQRGAAIGPIVELLPPELRLEAYASATDIGDPALRFELLSLIAPHLEGVDRDGAFLAALRSSRLLKEGYARSSALDKLKKFLPEAVWAEASAAEEARIISDRAAQSIKEKEQGEGEDSQSASSESPEVSPKYDYAELEQEASRGDLSRDRFLEIIEIVTTSVDYYYPTKIIEALTSRDDISQDHFRAILEKVAATDTYQATQIYTVIAPRLSRELQVVAIDNIWRGHGESFRVEKTEALIPFLAHDSLEQVVQYVTESPTFNSDRLLAAVASRLDEKGVEDSLKRVFAMESEYRRTDALGAIAPFLSPNLIETALEWALGLDGYYADKTISVLIPHLPVGRAVGVARSTKMENREAVLTAFASRMPREFLPEAVKLAVQITDMAERGRVLARLLPLLREAELSMAITDAYLAAFVIGDSSFRAFAQAALIPYLGDDYPRQSIVELCDELNQLAPGRDDFGGFFHAMALVLTSAMLTESEAAKTLERAIAEVRDVTEPGLRGTGFGVLSAHLPAEHGERLMKDAIELAREKHHLGPSFMIFLATFNPPEDIHAALENAKTEPRVKSDEGDETFTKALIRIVSALSTGGDTTEMKTEVAEGIKIINDTDKTMERLMCPLVMLLFAPKLSTAEMDDLIDETLTAINEVEETEIQGFSLALIASYLPTPRLWHCFSKLLDIAARSPRSGVFAGLAFAQGLVGECFKRNPTIGGNRIPRSPLTRLGGPTAISETMEAIHDVCSWWL